MPKPNVRIPAPMRDALLECFRATTRLVPPDLRRQLVLKTEDVDVAAPPEVIIKISEAVMAGAPNFSFESDGKLAFDAPQGFRVRVNMIELGGGCVDGVHAAEPLYEGSVASMSDLLLFRAVTVVDRGGEGDIWDFKWLLEEVARAGTFPKISEEEIDTLCKAGELVGGMVGRLVAIALLGINNEAAAMRLLGS
ncbi:hypothetical protein MAPG_08512 [Magnaporthiopsis poae ATCC 64411]|uniref:Uncharacterized protein n=1 Tax=Magnaporthiopsis poae (strain ATCC 64411 / 73-15) TaxID=644358 RepID=A0A0C4E7J9_MAGP6|nr:hypothetical protein MAPG_08512 [Magnaporthiopsis poae ATCC 64411]